MPDASRPAKGGTADVAAFNRCHGCQTHGGINDIIGNEPDEDKVGVIFHAVTFKDHSFRLGKISVYQAIENGEIPCVRIGRRILIPRHALERLLENSRPISKPAA